MLGQRSVIRHEIRTAGSAVISTPTVLDSQKHSRDNIQIYFKINSHHCKFYKIPIIFTIFILFLLFAFLVSTSFCFFCCASAASAVVEDWHVGMYQPVLIILIVLESVPVG
jgi:hypothetical protein